VLLSCDPAAEEVGNTFALVVGFLMV